MRPIIIVSVVSITFALILYTVAIWRNWRVKILTTSQLVLLWLALAADSLATQMMSMSVEETTWDLHTISGYSGLALMALLVIAGSWAMWQKREPVLRSFHRFAAPVWIFWFISYASGVVVGVQKASAITTGT
jgi:uncharacterized repeat protein (TIGR03987 family)